MPQDWRGWGSELPYHGLPGQTKPSLGGAGPTTAMVAHTRHQPILLLPSPLPPTPSPLPAHTISQSPSPDWFSARSGQLSARGLFKSGSVTALRPPPLSRSEPLSAGGGGGGRGGGMADADKPEVLRAAGDDSRIGSPRSRRASPGEPHPPEQEKRPAAQQLQWR